MNEKNSTSNENQSSEQWGNRKFFQKGSFEKEGKAQTIEPWKNTQIYVQGPML